MNTKEQKKISKFLSLVLRHRPEKIGIALDDAGWVDVDVLLTAINQHSRALTLDQLECVVRENDKQRFIFSDDQQRIRANQGHSVPVDLDHESAVPPDVLLHGTPERFVAAIAKQGLEKMQRHHVHLHADSAVANAVGARRGKAVLLRIRSGEMHRAGHRFWVTPNQVWLVDHVPAEFIDFPQ
ncbi:MAG: RNA 2'-phosphotransferase [Pirellulaceae bacterium]|nr:RNA 2'-phosphotransferase [Pirellulaceae bacterium]